MQETNSSAVSPAGGVRRVQKKGSSLSKTRIIFLIVAVAGAFLLGLRHIMPGEASRGGSFDSFCPFGAIETLYSYLVRGQTLKTTNLLNFTAFLGVLFTALVAGRAFCGWLCPLGGVQEFLASAVRRISGGGPRRIRGKASKAKLPFELPASLDKPLRNAKYLVLAGVIGFSIFTVYPPLHAICPARAVFSFHFEGWLPLVLVGFIGSSLLIERFSCKYLCPLGAVLALTNRFAPIRLVVGENKCNACGRCEKDCTMDIDPVKAEHDPECIRCLECLETCARPEGMDLKVL